MTINKQNGESYDLGYQNPQIIYQNNNKINMNNNNFNILPMQPMHATNVIKYE